MDNSLNSHYGIQILGKVTKKSTKIIVLGGSTSTVNVFRPKSWVTFLYEKLKKKLGDVVIYDFANSGNDVVVELLKFVRDGHFLEADYVVSMSGVNNIVAKVTMNQFNVAGSIWDKVEWGPTRWLKELDSHIKYCSGIEREEDLFDFWKRIQRIIKSVAEIYGAKYIGVLQPINCIKQNKSLFETMFFEEEVAESSADGFLKSSGRKDFYINLLDIFNDETDMYVDSAHYTEKANKIIADYILTQFVHSCYNIRHLETGRKRCYWVLMENFPQSKFGLRIFGKILIFMIIFLLLF